MQLAAQARKAWQKVFCKKAEENCENVDKAAAKRRLLRWQALTMVLSSLCLSPIFATTFLLRAPGSCNNTLMQNGTNTVLRETIFDTFHLSHPQRCHKEGEDQEDHNNKDDIFSPSMWLNITFFSGMAVGSVVFGVMADKLGRWVTMTVIVRGLIVAGLVASLSSNVYMFGVAWFLMAATSVGMFLVPVVLLVELVDRQLSSCFRLRLFMSLLYNFTWKFARLLPSLAIFLADTWFSVISITTLAISACYFTTEPFIWIGEQVSKRKEDEEENEKTPENIFHALKHNPILYWNMIILIIAWFTNGFTYYGLLGTIHTVTSNVQMFEDTTLSAVMAIFAKSLAMLVCLLTNRKLLPFLVLQFSTSLCFLCMIISSLVQGYNTRTALYFLAHLASFFGSTSFAILWSMTIEVFPKNYRASCTGIASGSARLGALAGTSAVGNFHLSTTGKAFALGLSLLTALLCKALPDMTLETLPDTLQKVESCQFPGRNRRSRSTVTYL